jgi:hypothetical protein
MPRNRPTSRPITALCLLAAVAAPAGADIIRRSDATTERYRVSQLPDFDQLRTATGDIPGLGLNGNFHCAPTATSDLLAYLSAHVVGGIGGVPVETWADYDAQEYAAANGLIDTVGVVMGTNISQNGTPYQNLWLGLRFYLPADQFTVLRFGRSAGSNNGLTTQTVVRSLTSALVEQPLGQACVFWMQTVGGTSFWSIAGGHCFAINEAIWNKVTGVAELDIRDPADSNRINPAEPTSAQSTFTTAIYAPQDATFQLAAGGSITGGRMPGFASGNTQGVLSALTVVYPLTVYTTDFTGSVPYLTRPLRFEFDAPAASHAFGAALSLAAADIGFDFVSQRVYMVTGSATNAQCVWLDGTSSPATAVPTSGAIPKRLATGRFGEVFVLATSGALLRVPTAGTGTTYTRTLPAVPDAICYDDAKDQLYGYVAATRTLLTIPRLEGGTIVSQVAPSAVTAAGEISMSVNPINGTVWIAGSATNGKLFGLTPGSGASVASVEVLSNSAVQVPKSLRTLGDGRLVFSSGTALRVLAKSATAGTWSTDTASRLWNVPTGPQFDLSRDRTDVGSTDPVNSLILAKLPTDVPVTAPSCDADLNLDGKVDGADLSVILANWGHDGLGDFNQDDVVDGNDLGFLLANWGTCP